MHCGSQYAAPHREKKSYSPFNANHPGSPQNLPISPDRTHGFSRVTESDSECVHNFRIRFRFGARTKRAEIFYSEGIFVWWIAEDDDVGRLIWGS